MFENFRRIDSSEKINLVEYIKEKISEEKIHTIKIHAGCDSQNRSTKTNYVLVVALRYGDNGVHVLYKSFYLDKIRDVFTRLKKETEYVIELAENLKENGITVDYIDMDFNGKEKHKSNQLIGFSKGWAEFLGYKVKVKPEELIACKAADYLLK